MPGSLHIFVASFFVFWLCRMTKTVFYVCLLTHFARQDGQNRNSKNKQNHENKATKIQKKTKLGAISILRKDIGVGGWSRKWQFSLTLCSENVLT